MSSTSSTTFSSGTLFFNNIKCSTRVRLLTLEQIVLNSPLSLIELMSFLENRVKVNSPGQKTLADSK